MVYKVKEVLRKVGLSFHVLISSKLVIKCTTYVMKFFESHNKQNPKEFQIFFNKEL